VKLFGARNSGQQPAAASNNMFRAKIKSFSHLSICLNQEPCGRATLPFERRGGGRGAPGKKEQSSESNQKLSVG
jgi:hypothetical protein